MSSKNACHCASSSPASSRGKALDAVLFGGALLSSSCCLIQLLFNALQWGCAGFALLEPYKHHARAATAALLVHKLVREGFNRRTLALATLVLLVASSQDILAAHNKGQINIQSFKSVLAPLARYRLLPQGLVVALGGAQGNTTNASAGSPPGSWGSSSSGSGSSGSSSGGSVAAARQLQQVVWQVEGMKCEGCANYLKSMLQQLPGVESCTVDFALKRVQVDLDVQRTTAEAVEQAITELEYQAVRTGQT